MSPDYPFYSHQPGVGFGNVCHTHPDCQIGQSIAPAFRLPGNPLGWPECAFCLVHREDDAKLAAGAPAAVHLS